MPVIISEYGVPSWRGRAQSDRNTGRSQGGMSEEEQLELLASDGKLVKRPLVIGEDFVLVGFKPEEWEKVLLK